MKTTFMTIGATSEDLRHSVVSVSVVSEMTWLSVAISPLFSLPQARMPACPIILAKSPPLLSSSSTGNGALVLRPGRPVCPGPGFLGISWGQVRVSVVNLGPRVNPSSKNLPLVPNMTCEDKQ